MRRPLSLRYRLIGLAVIWSLFLLLAGGLALSWVFAQSVRDSFDDRLDVLLKNLIAEASFDTPGDRPLIIPGEPRFERPLSGWYWQIESADRLLRSRSLWDRDLPRTEEDEVIIRGPLAQQLRMLSRTVELQGQVYRFRLAGETGSIVLATQRFIVTVGMALAALGVGLVAAVVFQVWYGLRPLRQLRTGLAAVRAGEHDRLDGRFPSELTPLVDELNGLLAHNRAVIDRARAHTGNLAHALKTPLSIIANDARAGDDMRLAETTRRQLPRIQHLIDHHLSRARTAAGGTDRSTLWTPVAPAIEDLARTLERLHGHRGVRIERKVPAAARFRGDREDLMEVVGNLLENACKWATQRIVVGVEPAPVGLLLTVDDDGPGLSEAERGKVIERGQRLDERVPGHGLGLSIVRDVVALYAGELNLETSPLGGLQARVTLPGSLSEPGAFEARGGPKVLPSVRRWIGRGHRQREPSPVAGESRRNSSAFDR